MLLLLTALDILHALEKKETKQDGNWTVTLESQIIEGVGIIRGVGTGGWEIGRG